MVKCEDKIVTTTRDKKCNNYYFEEKQKVTTNPELNKSVKKLENTRKQVKS